MNTTPAPTDRRSDLDALRAVAMLLGLVLHAALSFFPSFWVVADRRQDASLAIFVSAVHGFRMPLFFVLSGFFSAMLLERRGLGGFVRHRFRRVFLPLLLGMATLVPLTNWISAVTMSSAPRGPAAGTPGEGGASLWAAAEAGDLEAIGSHLAGGEPVDGRDGETGLSPLHRAALGNRADAVAYLVRRGADVDAEAIDGGTPLHAAAFVGGDAAVAALLENGADVNATNRRGHTPLDNATIDEETTLMFASLLRLPVAEDGLGRRKAAIAEALRERGGTPGQTSGLAEVLMQLPVFNYLWFLWFLWWLALGLAAASALAARRPTARPPAWAVASPARYFWLVPLTMIPQWFMGEGGASPSFGPDTSTGLLPMPHVFAYYAIFFGFGALSYGTADRTHVRWWLPLSLGLFVVFPLGMALSLGWPAPLGETLAPTVRRASAVFLQASYPWLMTFGLMGLFRRACPVASPTMRYLSDSAYWLYLAHLPLVIAAQYAVRDWPAPALAKLAIVVVSVTAALLASYQVLVRHTWLGRLLNGSRPRAEASGEAVVG